MSDVGNKVVLKDLSLVAYINLAHREDRRNHMEAVLAHCPCPTLRVEATRLIENPETLGLTMRKGFTGHRGVASIYLSHVQAIEKAAAVCGDRPFAVLEDDVHVAEDFWSTIIEGLPDDWELILVSPRFRSRQPSETPDGRKRFERILEPEAPQRLADFRDAYFVTGAHFVIYRNAQTAFAVHRRLVDNAIYDVDVFYVDAAVAIGFVSEAVKAGRFGSDHASAGNIRTMFVHMGLHQSGSAHIQRFLRDNRKHFPERYAVFVQGDPVCNALKESCLQYQKVAERGGNLEHRETAIRNSIVKMIEACPPRASVLVISDEELSGFMPGRLGVRVVYPAVHRIAKVIRDAVPDKAVTFVFYRREAEAWVENVYNHAVRQHGEWLDLEGFRQSLLGSLEGTSYVEMVRQAVGPAAVLDFCFEKEVQEANGLVHGFLKSLGLPDEAIEGFRAPDMGNENLDLDFLNVMRGINKLRYSDKEISESAIKEIRRIIMETQKRRKNNELSL